MRIVDGIKSFVRRLKEKKNKHELEEEKKMNGKEEILFSSGVLEDFRKNVGKYKAETGGMLASSKNKAIIDRCHFDTHSQNTPGTFYYDVDSMSKVYRDWKANGYTTNGIYHSHPKGVIRPSYHDISSALLHIEFFGLDYFYLPILQPNPSGYYTMYFYVVKKEQNDIEVELQYVLRAVERGYEYLPFAKWKKRYSVKQLHAYRRSIEDTHHSPNNVTEETEKKVMPRKVGKTTEISVDKNKRFDMKEENHMSTGNNQTILSSNPYFQKVSGLYTEHALDKVIVCVGTGGARSFLENMARSGFRNYILIDADVVSPSNIATQGVYISEVGKKKVDVLRDRILDINPGAKVLCVDRFLDDTMRDEEFKGYLDCFANKKPTDYLILGCTDNFDAQKRSSFLALKYGMPYLAAMMYEGGAAAEIIFVYPGVTKSCPRCLLRDRFEKYEKGFQNDVDSSGCPIFATERMNALKGYIALMLLMYGEDSKNPFSRMLDDVKDRNFVQIRLNPYLKESNLGIGLFDRVFSDASKYVYFDETLWIPQHPDAPEYGEKPCRLCGGTGNLKQIHLKWAKTDTRKIRFDNPAGTKKIAEIKLEHGLVG
ncbi:MAG: ThiF family adenylyltransferase [Lachnospiraceae bacterium]